MRLNTFNRKDYLYSRRLAIIQKANSPLQVRIQMIANKVIDEFIFTTNNDDYSINPYYEEEIFGNDISQQNMISVNNQLSRLLDKGIITQNSITNMEKYIAAKKISDNITKAEIDRVNKNLRYVERVINEADLNLDIYRNLTEKLPTTVSRQSILQRALEKGENYKGREYSYKELKNLSRDLETYKVAHLDYEKAKIENNQAQREGLGNINTTKTWIWSELEKTRHHGMDGQTVGLYEKFEVVNENTGDMDMLRFPHDIENEHNNCSNTCNCACSYEIN